MKKQLLQAALAAGCLGALPAAHAVATLSFQLDGGATIYCADNSACDDNDLVGVVQYDAAIGAVIVNVTTGLSKPLMDGDPLMDLNSVNVTADPGVQHTLVIGFSDTGFTNDGAFSGIFGGTLNGAGASVVANAYYSTANTLFTNTSAMGEIGPFGPGAYSGSFWYGLAPDGFYSVTQYLTLTTSASAKTTFSGDFAVNVPEPTTLALMGLGFGLFGFGLRRRQQAN